MPCSAFSCLAVLVIHAAAGCRHTECLWFANLANNLLWWAYVKAAWRSLMARIFFCCSQITFKATAKVRCSPAAL